MSREYVFTITQGRTGTGSLARLFADADPNALVAHEHLHAAAHGTLTPDVGTMRRFNTYGLTKEISAFWDRKFKIIDGMLDEAGKSHYVETAHMNAKAGLVEYVLTNGRRDCTFIVLDRALEKVARSMAERGDMREPSNMWLWYLDPSYPRNRVAPAYYAQHDLGLIAWYVDEMQARKLAYGTSLVAAGFRVHRCSIDGPWRERICDFFDLGLPAEQEPTNANSVRPERKAIEKHFADIFLGRPNTPET